jgi:hypothetical protein
MRSFIFTSFLFGNKILSLKFKGAFFPGTAGTHKCA